jgi:hypothetical protein
MPASGQAAIGASKLPSRLRRPGSKPGRVAARQEVDDVSTGPTESNCASGDAASVQDELQRFLAAFRTSRIGANVNQRLQDVRAGRSGIRPKCTVSQ